MKNFRIIKPLLHTLSSDASNTMLKYVPLFLCCVWKSYLHTSPHFFLCTQVAPKAVDDFHCKIYAIHPSLTLSIQLLSNWRISSNLYLPLRANHQHWDENRQKALSDKRGPRRTNCSSCLTIITNSTIPYKVVGYLAILLITGIV